MLYESRIPRSGLSNSCAAVQPAAVNPTGNVSPSSPPGTRVSPLSCDRRRQPISTKSARVNSSIFILRQRLITSFLMLEKCPCALSISLKEQRCIYPICPCFPHKHLLGLWGCGDPGGAGPLRYPRNALSYPAPRSNCCLLKEFRPQTHRFRLSNDLECTANTAAAELHTTFTLHSTAAEEWELRPQWSPCSTAGA